MKEFFEFGDDIPEAPERKMIEIIGEPAFLCRFPVEMTPFYMKKDPRLTESCCWRRRDCWRLDAYPRLRRADGGMHA
jgi:hypothetical protein